MVSVLFVCLGNICRSPTAEAVFRAKAQKRGLEQQLIIDSAGTSHWHQGNPPDKRSQEAAGRRGYNMARLKARQVTSDDFDRFDFILAMDESNYGDLAAMQPPNTRAALHLYLRDFGQHNLHEVPDPYYGGTDGFEQVLDLLESASDSLLDAIEASITKGRS